ncbi:MAG: hypothetical protein AAEJ47_00305, partial [Planctomycetota bacterium]
MRIPLFNDLIDQGLLNEEQLSECQEEELATGKALDKVLREKGYVTEAALLEVLSRRLRIPYVEDLAESDVPADFTLLVPAQFARTYNLIAIGEVAGVLQVATCDPLDVQPMDDLAATLARVIEPVISPRAEITALINRAYQKSSADVDELLEGLDEDDLIG